MTDIFQPTQFARPSTIRKLPSSMGRASMRVQEYRDLFEASLLEIGVARTESQSGEGEHERIRRFFSWCAVRPVIAPSGPPPAARVLGRPGDAVVASAFWARDLIAAITEIRETADEPRVHQRRPSSRAHWSQSALIPWRSPLCAGAIGSTPVIAVRAQNQWSGSSSSSLRSSGRALRPIPMICW